MKNSNSSKKQAQTKELPNKSIYVKKVQVSPDSPLPSPRTYHASCLISKYMVTISGEANSDLKDLWAFDLD